MANNNYIDFDTFLLNNVFSENVLISSNLNANATEFIPRCRNHNTSQENQVSNTIDNSSGNNRRSKENNGKKQKNQRSNKRSDNWNRQREVEKVLRNYNGNESSSGSEKVSK